jgi:peptidoglycan LD-endopeptidase CwlK
MKVLIKTAVDVAHTKQVAQEVTELFKTYNVPLDITVEDVVLDMQNPLLYTTQDSWSFLVQKKTTSIAWAIVYAFHKPTYQITCLFVDKKLGNQDADLRGQYENANGVGLIEIYSEPTKYIRRTQRKGQFFYDTVSRKTKLRNDTHVLFHEIVHHLERCAGLDGLHKAELAGVDKQYIETVLVLLSDKKKLQPRVERLSQEFLKRASQAGIPCQITESYRTLERQTELYNQGRTTKGNIVTNAKAGESLHNYGVAFDIVPRAGYNISNAQWAKLGEIGVSLGLEWGGSKEWIKAGFIDNPHMQLTLGYSLKQFKNGDIDWTRFF